MSAIRPEIKRPGIKRPGIKRPGELVSDTRRAAPDRTLITVNVTPQLGGGKLFEVVTPYRTGRSGQRLDGCRRYGHGGGGPKWGRPGVRRGGDDFFGGTRYLGRRLDRMLNADPTPLTPY